jgi:hypothetical protein
MIDVTEEVAKKLREQDLYKELYALVENHLNDVTFYPENYLVEFEFWNEGSEVWLNLICVEFKFSRNSNYRCCVAVNFGGQKFAWRRDVDDFNPETSKIFNLQDIPNFKNVYQQLASANHDIHYLYHNFLEGEFEPLLNEFYDKCVKEAKNFYDSERGQKAIKDWKVRKAENFIWSINNVQPTDCEEFYKMINEAFTKEVIKE